MNVAVVVSTTSKTTTSRMLAVLAYTTMPGGDVTAVLTGVRESGRHLSYSNKTDSKETAVSKQHSKTTFLLKRAETIFPIRISATSQRPKSVIHHAPLSCHPSRHLIHPSRFTRFLHLQQLFFVPKHSQEHISVV